MQIATILGSPRKQGNTATILKALEERLVEQQHQVDRINITDYTVKGCLGCDACRKVKDEFNCAQRDDAESLFTRMIAADLIVYSTPLYCWGFTAQMKALMDRHYCLVKWDGTPDYFSFLAQKPTMLLVTCGDAVENNADLIQTLFDRENSYCKSAVMGKYVVPYCTTPEALGEDGLEAANDMFRAIQEVQR